MATLSEFVDLDSGVASSEATPEGQTVITGDTEGTVKMALTGDSILEVTKEVKEEEKDKEKNAVVPTTNGSSSAAALDEEEEEDEDVDESLGERLYALTEMFPDSLRRTTANIASSSISLVKSSYSLTRQVVWIAVSTSIILFAPVMFELERLNVEEMMKQDRNRLVLGPGSAMSGPPATPGLMPPPPSR
ncbi:hypothetical protein SK128_002609 [Halocaridina rubra]|uniref:Mitochondrial import receptor subunit TOM22 homolog n=1 Tax=Halocaridina rubra TaxID=373956 RepID=A0AAN9AAM9_HALRR